MSLSILPLLRLAPLGRHRHRQLARQISAGERVRLRHDLGRRALRDDLAAMDAGARADVDDVVGLQDRVLVMLDHDHRVAEIAQAPQRLQQALVVALVQADRRLVQHVEHAGEARADLRGQADALALAARQRAGVARQGEVIEPDIDQEAQPLADLLQDAAGDLVLLGRRAARAERRTRPAPRAPTAATTSPIWLPSIFTASASGLSRIAVAGLARRLGHEAADLLARPVAVGLLPAPLEIASRRLRTACFTS